MHLGRYAGLDVPLPQQEPKHQTALHCTALYNPTNTATLRCALHPSILTLDFIQMRG